VFFYLNFSFLSVSVWKDFFVWHSYLSNNLHQKEWLFSNLYIFLVAFLLYFPCPSFPTYYYRTTLVYRLWFYIIFSSFMFFIWQTRLEIESPFFSIFCSFFVSLLRTSHIFLIHLLSVALFFSFLLVTRKILRLSFHSFVFNRKCFNRRWLYGFLPCCQFLW